MLQNSCSLRHLPHRSLVEVHFAAAPGPLGFLDLAPPEDGANAASGAAAAAPAALSELEKPPTAWLLAASALRAARTSAVIRRRWGASPFLRLLRHEQPHVRWVGAEGVTLHFQLVRHVSCELCAAHRLTARCRHT